MLLYSVTAVFMVFKLSMRQFCFCLLFYRILMKRSKPSNKFDWLYKKRQRSGVRYISSEEEEENDNNKPPTTNTVETPFGCSTGLSVGTIHAVNTTCSLNSESSAAYKNTSRDSAKSSVFSSCSNTSTAETVKTTIPSTQQILKKRRTKLNL